MPVAQRPGRIELRANDRHAARGRTSPRAMSDAAMADLSSRVATAQSSHFTSTGVPFATSWLSTKASQFAIRMQP